MNASELKDFLDLKYLQYAKLDFIENDPICIPHQFKSKEDIEIAGFIAATLAWGLRKTIINNCNWLITHMDNRPYDFILNHNRNDLKVFKQFKHRTFNGVDCIFFIKSLQHIYKNKGGIENCFKVNHKVNKVEMALIQFRSIFFELADEKHRTKKHVSSPLTKSTCKRLNMYLRWMVRKDQVDFGIWTCFKKSDLLLPLDLHTGRMSRLLLLLERPQNDWLAVLEISNKLKQLDPLDPIKYDLSLFGLGVTKELV